MLHIDASRYRIQVKSFAHARRVLYDFLKADFFEIENENKFCTFSIIFYTSSDLDLVRILTIYIFYLIMLF